jgi:hypothetical protein
MTDEPPDPVTRRLWITLMVSLALLAAVGGAIAWLDGR